jgi:hypothetical protein
MTQRESLIKSLWYTCYFLDIYRYYSLYCSSRIIKYSFIHLKWSESTSLHPSALVCAPFIWLHSSRYYIAVHAYVSRHLLYVKRGLHCSSQVKSSWSKSSIIVSFLNGYVFSQVLLAVLKVALHVSESSDIRTRGYYSYSIHWLYSVIMRHQLLLVLDCMLLITITISASLESN